MLIAHVRPLFCRLRRFSDVQRCSTLRELRNAYYRGGVVNDLGIRLAGVDILSADISQPLAANGGRFGEINTTPGLHHHYLIAQTRKGPGIAEILLDHLFTTRSGVFVLGDNARTASAAVEACDAA